MDPAEKLISQPHIHHTEFVCQDESGLQKIKSGSLLLFHSKSKGAVHGAASVMSCTLCHSSACSASRGREQDGPFLCMLIDIKQNLLDSGFSCSRSSGDNTDRISKGFPHSLLLFCRQTDGKLLFCLIQNRFNVHLLLLYIIQKGR